MPRCKGLTSKGCPCKNFIRSGDLCRYHLPKTRHSKEEVTPGADKPQKETCCVCYEDTDEQLIECKHPICKECLYQLPKPECPVCRRPLKGKGVNKDLLRSLENREDESKKRQEEADFIVAIMRQYYPFLSDDYVYDFYQGLLS